MRTSCELHSLFILNPDDYERGRMSPNGTQSTGAHYVWYIKPPDTLAGVFLLIENSIQVVSWTLSE